MQVVKKNLHANEPEGSTKGIRWACGDSGVGKMQKVAVGGD